MCILFNCIELQYIHYNRWLLHLQNIKVEKLLSDVLALVGVNILPAVLNILSTKLNSTKTAFIFFLKFNITFEIAFELFKSKCTKKSSNANANVLTSNANAKIFKSSISNA